MIKLINSFQFDIEEYNKKRIRLVLYNNNTEVACRKENIRVFLNFLQQNDGSIFKGRIILYKKEEFIDIFFKGDFVGRIKVDEFIKKIDIISFIQSI